MTFGIITLDGLQYLERPHIFAFEQKVTLPGQVFEQQRLTLPGYANFMLKGLTRDMTSPTQPGSVDRRFRFCLRNTEGATWFFSSGLGILDDRIVDTLCFGSAQFPYPVIPPVPVHAAGSLFWELEDLAVPGTPDAYPYTIHFGFHGTYLIPVGSTVQPATS